MSEKAPVTESKPDGADAPAAPVVRRSPGHRGQDVRDTVAEMAARAHEISLEAGSKMAAAMKDVINAAAGLLVDVNLSLLFAGAGVLLVIVTFYSATNREVRAMA